MAISNADLEFLDSRGMDWETLRAGYVRNLDTDLKKQYWDVYKRNIDKTYQLDLSCRDCLFDMLIRLMNWYDTEKAEIEATRAAEAVKTKSKTRKEGAE